MPEYDPKKWSKQPEQGLNIRNVGNVSGIPELVRVYRGAISTWNGTCDERFFKDSAKLENGLLSIARGSAYADEVDRALERSS